MNFVLHTTPTHLSEKVLLGTNIEVSFMFDINVSTLNEQNIILFNMTERKAESVSITYKAKLLTVKPSKDLKPNCHYQVQLVGGQSGIKDITGRTLNDTYVFEFKTHDIEKIKPPMFLFPTDLSEITGDTVFRWTEAAGAYFYELEISRSNTFDVLAWPKANERVYATEFIPDVDYRKGQYYARIRTVNNEGFKSAYSSVIRFYYDGLDEIPDYEQGEIVPASMPFVQLYRAKAGDQTFKLDRPYQPGTGQLSVYLNGLKIQPTSGLTTDDGEYHEIDANTVVFSEPLLDGDAIEFRIDGALQEEIVIKKLDVRPAEVVEPKSQLEQLQQHFSIKVESAVIDLVSASPTADASNLSAGKLKEIVIEFSEPIDPSSINFNTVYLVPEKN